jgi:hypothetical protein
VPFAERETGLVTLITAEYVPHPNLSGTTGYMLNWEGTDTVEGLEVK